MFQQNDFLQLDVPAVLCGFRADDQGVPFLQNHISTGHNIFPSPADHRHDHTVGQAEIHHLHADPPIPGFQACLNEMNILLFPVLTHTLQTGILIHKAGRNNTGRNGNHTHAEEGDDYTEYFPQRGNGIDVAVANGQQGGYRPPDAGKCVGEHIRLGLMLQTVHTKAGGHHQNKNNKYRRHQLLLFAGNDRRNHVDGIEIGIDLKQAENTNYAEHTEHRRTGREYDGQIVGQKGQQVNDTRKGQQVLFRCPPFRQVFVQMGCRPHTQHIVHRKEGNRDLLQNGQRKVVGRHCRKGIHYGHDQVDNQHNGAKPVISPTEPVTAISYLNDFMGALAALFPYHFLFVHGFPSGVV